MAQAKQEAMSSTENKNATKSREAVAAAAVEATKGPNLNRSKAREMKDGPLNSYAKEMFKAVSDDKAYPLLVEVAKNLGEKSAIFDAIYSASETYGGKDRTKSKKQERGELLKAIYAVMDKLEETYNGDPNYYLNAKCEVEVAPSRKTGTVEPPVVSTKKIPSLRRGEVDFIVKTDIALEIKGVVGCSSLDNITWSEDNIFSPKLKFTVTGLPSGKTVWFKFKLLATNNRQSVYCVPFPVEVF